MIWIGGADARSVSVLIPNPLKPGNMTPHFGLSV